MEVQVILSEFDLIFEELPENWAPKDVSKISQKLFPTKVEIEQLLKDLKK